MKYFKFKVIVDGSDEVVFEAYVKDKNTYHIIKDSRFIRVFKKLINGTYTNDIVNKYNTESKTVLINSNNAIENLKKFRDEISNIYGYSTSIVETEIPELYSVSFYGPNYNMEYGMDPEIPKKTSEFNYDIAKIFVANDPEYQKLTLQKAGSIIFENYATSVNSEQTDSFIKALNDLKNEEIDTLLFKTNMFYRKIIKEFDKLRNFESLDKVVFKAGGVSEPYIFNDFEWIKDKLNNMFGDTVSDTYKIEYVKANYSDKPTKAALVVSINGIGEYRWFFNKDNEDMRKLFLKNISSNIILTGKQLTEHTFELNSFKIVK